MVMHKLTAEGKHDKYRDTELKRVVQAGEEVDITLKRVKQVNDALEEHGMQWERVEEEESAE